MYFEDKKALMLYRKGSQFKRCGKLKGGTLVFRRKVWRKVKFAENRKYGSDAHFLKDCKEEGFKIYSVSKYNYVCMRRKDTSTHTQKRSAKKFMYLCKKIRHTRRFIPYITKKIRSWSYEKKIKWNKGLHILCKANIWNPFCLTYRIRNIRLASEIWHYLNRQTPYMDKVVVLICYMFLSSYIIPFKLLFNNRRIAPPNWWYLIINILHYCKRSTLLIFFN